MDTDFDKIVETVMKRWRLTNDDSFYRGILAGLRLSLTYGDKHDIEIEMELIKKQIDEIQTKLGELEK